MSEETKKQIDELLKNETSNDWGIWVLMILTLLFAPTKQEPPIININIGDGKNV